MHDAQVAKMEENYKKAQKRAEKKGRKIPPRDEYYYYWGYPYMMYGPWVYPIYWSPGFYYCDPGVAAAGTGYAGACAAGKSPQTPYPEVFADSPLSRPGYFLPLPTRY
jgi:hypothetical protein